MEIEAVGPIGLIRPPAVAQPEPEQPPAPDGAAAHQIQGRILPEHQDREQAAVSPPPNAYSRFILDQNNRLVAVQVINAENGEVLREIPPEAVRQALQLPGGLVNVQR